MIPKHEYILDTDEKIPVVTRKLLRRYHTKSQVLDFIYFLWGGKATYLDNGEQCFEASKYEEWIDKQYALTSPCS